jgi:hypothetical protein
MHPDGVLPADRPSTAVLAICSTHDPSLTWTAPVAGA